MNPIRLSICIATFNRGRFIGETLMSVLSQASDEVEVVVADGASTDNTEQVVRDFAERHPSLRYTRFERKGGVDQDYTKSVELARGEYVWLFTDDDLMQPGAIAAVLEAARRNYSLIIVNAEVRNLALDRQIAPRRIKWESDRVFSLTSPERNDFLATVGGYLTFIGCMVIKRELWNCRDKAGYFGTAFVHIGVIFQSLLPGSVLVMARPWIVIRYGNAEWVPRKFGIWMFSLPALIWSFPDYADWAKKRVIPREPWRSLLVLLLNRAMGHYSLKDYEERLALLPQSQIGRNLRRAVAIAPIAPLNILARLIVRWVFWKHPSITLTDLEAWGRQAK
ncbi:MAG TPA: glycosyltransferase family 2 protein [Verrucomicrobiae bacterium]|nr:glycosyltransferase family 2 protein [Verrucomicrobiae bacterium]